MRPSYSLVCALLAPAVIGCSDSIPSPPPPPVVTPTPVHILSDVQPTLVAYRNGFVDDKGNLVPWTSATPSKSVTLMIDGVYSVAVVCTVGNDVVIWQASHTVDDDRADDKSDPMLQTPCTMPAARNAVTGTLVKAGTVHIDDVSTAELDAASQFTLQVASGTFDVIASDPGDMKALIQRDVAISGAKDLGAIDAATGVALTPVAKLTLDNPPKAPDPTDPMDPNTETVEAKVLVATKNNSTPGEVFFAPFNLTTKKVSAFAYPSAMLAADDAQSAAFIGHNTFTVPDIADTTTTDPMKQRQTTVTTTRSQTRPLTDAAASGMTTFQLPALIKTPGWGVDAQNRLSVALPALPALDDLTVSTSGTSTGGTPVTYQVHVTATFFQRAALARPVFDTALPSFPSGSQIDFTKAYSRDIVSQHDVVSKGNVVGHETSEFHQEVSALAR